MIKKYGLIGRELSYSHSKIIHEYLIKKHKIKATYDLIETDQLDKELLFFYDGLNITIPYKEEVLAYLANEMTLPCNTIKKVDDKLFGYNTDIEGIKATLEKYHKEIKSVVILGSGATSKLVQSLFKEVEVIVISRNDKVYNYAYLTNLQADILVNTTPVGMNENRSPIEEDLIENYQLIFDLNYNPLNSKLALLAKKHNVEYYNGLEMLIVQALKAFEIWHDLEVDTRVIKEIYYEIIKQTSTKIALIGMPFSGKTTMVNKYDGCDLDFEIEKRTKQSIPELMENNSFRLTETKVLQELVAKNCSLIACGGGVVLDQNNIKLLKDYTIIYLEVPLTTLEKRYQTGQSQKQRPLIKNVSDLKTIYEQRQELYKKYSNLILEEEELEKLLKEF